MGSNWYIVTRRHVLSLLAALNPPEEFSLNAWEDWNGDPVGELFAAVMSAFFITENEVIEAAEDRQEAFRDAQSDRGDSDGQ